MLHSPAYCNSNDRTSDQMSLLLLLLRFNKLYNNLYYKMFFKKKDASLILKRYPNLMNAKSRHRYCDWWFKYH